MSRRLARIIINRRTGMIYVDGVCIGRKIVQNGRPMIEVKDRDKRRVANLGRPFVLFSPSKLEEALKESEE